MSEELIPHRGNYKKLLSYQKSDVIFQLTYYFCHKYLQRGDRTIDQMVQDYLKTRGHRQWEENSVELEAMRRIGREHNDGEYFIRLAQMRPPETIANMAIVLIKQADYLLHRQLQRLADAFTREGGFSERMMRVRKSYRNNQS